MGCNVSDEEAAVMRWKAGRLKSPPHFAPGRYRPVFEALVKGGFLDKDGCLTGIALDWIEFDKHAA